MLEEEDIRGNDLGFLQTANLTLEIGWDSTAIGRDRGRASTDQPRSLSSSNSRALVVPVCDPTLELFSHKKPWTLGAVQPPSFVCLQNGSRRGKNKSTT